MHRITAILSSNSAFSYSPLYEHQRRIYIKKVKQQYPNAIECSIVDHSDGCGAKLELTVVSDSFEGVMLLKRHRAIQNHLKEKGLFDEIHALQIKAWTPSQWEKKKGDN